MSKKYFVTSDVHSFLDELMVSLKEKGFEMDNQDHILCICGDLFDRGNQTRELFEFVKELQEQDRLIYVAGNHESLLFDCMEEIYRGQVPSSHHFHNGTVKTICQFCDQNEWIVYDPTWRDKICEIMQPVLDFISDNCIDYIEIGKYILVHGYIPLCYGAENFWMAPPEDWERARWENGMDMWQNPRCRVPGKTVVVGHWHCSYGWSHIRQERKEWPNKCRNDWKKSFEPFIDDGIMAIDACTAYTGFCNVIVIEEDANGDN